MFLMVFYKLFLERKPNSSSYKFNDYLSYLTGNMLIYLNETSKKYEISKEGEHFLSRLEENGINWEIISG